MSLSGFLPPLCDNGSMLMDGGYLNNVPADVMRDLGAKVIVAVDVGSAEDNTLMNYGDTLSGWWVLLNSFNPFAKGGKIPTLNDIQSKLAYTSSVPLREKTAKMEGCYYLRPPICQYQTMDFAKFKEIEQIGYDYATKIIQEWNEKGILEEQFGVKLVKPSSFARRASI
jgi:lysophospholipid hydrolase